MFKVGDRVDTRGFGLGTIVDIDMTSLIPYSVKHDNFNTKLHDLDGKCENGYGLWYDADWLTLVEESTVDRDSKVVMKFKVGDRVDTGKYGLGTIVFIDAHDPIMPYGVNHDSYNRGLHTLGYRCEFGYGFWYGADKLALIEEELSLVKGGDMKFKVGDRVDTGKYGLGTIVLIDTKYWRLPYGVKHDNYHNSLHDLDRSCGVGYGLWYEEEDLTSIDKEKLMTRMEAFQYLIDNPDEVVEQITLSDGVECAREYYVKDGLIAPETLIFVNDLSKFRVKPKKKLKEMTFGEAFSVIQLTEGVSYSGMVSVLTGKDMNRLWYKISKEEYMGLWIVKDVFEE